MTSNQISSLGTQDIRFKIICNHTQIKIKSLCAISSISSCVPNHCIVRSIFEFLPLKQTAALPIHSIFRILTYWARLLRSYLRIQYSKQIESLRGQQHQPLSPSAHFLPFLSFLAKISHTTVFVSASVGQNGILQRYCEFSITQ